MIAQKYPRTVLISLFLLVFVLAICALSLGYASKSFSDVLATILGRASQSTNFIILQIRLPRVIACIVGGASLALSGMLLQTLTRNPLADSGILGINTGAGLMVAVTVSLFDITNPLVMSLMPIFAVLGGGATILLVYVIARKPNHGISPTRLIITGVGISSMLAGVMVSVVSSLDEYQLDYITQWLSGKITGDDWPTLAILTPLLGLAWLLTYSRAQRLNILNLNEQTAMALGLDLQQERLIALTLSTILAGLSVVIVGNITFVGMVAGHISRRFLSSDHRINLPASMMVGSSLLLIADTIGRVLLVGTGIPTGLIVSMIGAPYFLILMYRQK